MWCAWQTLWDQQTLNKIQPVNPTVDKWKSQGLSRKVVFTTGFKIGPCPLTHGYLMARKYALNSLHRKTLLRVRHIFEECLDSQIHNKNSRKIIGQIFIDSSPSR